MEAARAVLGCRSPACYMRKCAFKHLIPPVGMSTKMHAAICQTLAHARRLEIIERLRKGEQTVGVWRRRWESVSRTSPSTWR